MSLPAKEDGAYPDARLLPLLDFLAQRLAEVYARSTQRAAEPSPAVSPQPGKDGSQ